MRILFFPHRFIQVLFTRQLSTDCNLQGKLTSVFWKTRLTNRCIVLNIQHWSRREIKLCIFSSRAGRGLQLSLIKTPAICFSCLLPMSYTYFQLKYLHLFLESQFVTTCYYSAPLKLLCLLKYRIRKQNSTSPHICTPVSCQEIPWQCILPTESWDSYKDIMKLLEF